MSSHRRTCYPPHLLPTSIQGRTLFQARDGQDIISVPRLTGKGRSACSGALSNEVGVTAGRYFWTNIASLPLVIPSCFYWSQSCAALS